MIGRLIEEISALVHEMKKEREHSSKERVVINIFGCKPEARCAKRGSFDFALGLPRLKTNKDKPSTKRQPSGISAQPHGLK